MKAKRNGGSYKHQQKSLRYHNRFNTMSRSYDKHSRRLRKKFNRVLKANEMRDTGMVNNRSSLRERSIVTPDVIYLDEPLNSVKVLTNSNTNQRSTLSKYSGPAAILTLMGIGYLNKKRYKKPKKKSVRKTVKFLNTENTKRGTGVLIPTRTRYPSERANKTWKRIYENEKITSYSPTRKAGKSKKKRRKKKEKK